MEQKIKTNTQKIPYERQYKDPQENSQYSCGISRYEVSQVEPQEKYQFPLEFPTVVLSDGNYIQVKEMVAKSSRIPTEIW